MCFFMFLTHSLATLKFIATLLPVRLAATELHRQSSVLSYGNPPNVVLLILRYILHWHFKQLTQTRHVFIYHGTKETSCYNGFSVPSTMKNFNNEPPTGTGRSHGLRPIFQQSIKRAARARSRLEMKRMSCGSVFLQDISYWLKLPQSFNLIWNKWL